MRVFDVRRAISPDYDNFIDIHSLPLSTLLSPFLAIIRSPLSTGPITSAALTALHNFFLCGLFYPEAASLQSALSELSSALSSCKFEASDSSGDEVVLLKIMTIIQDAMCGSIGLTLGDIEICEMLETVLTTSCQMRLSGQYQFDLKHVRDSQIFVEILRRSAEGTLHQLVRIAFSRLCDLDPASEEQKLADGGEMEGGEMKMSVSVPEAQLQAEEPKASTEQQVSDTKELEEVAPVPEAEQPSPETPGVPRPPCGYSAMSSKTLQY